MRAVHGDVLQGRRVEDVLADEDGPRASHSGVLPGEAAGLLQQLVPGEAGPVQPVQGPVRPGEAGQHGRLVPCAREGSLVHPPPVVGGREGQLVVAVADLA